MLLESFPRGKRFTGDLDRLRSSAFIFFGQLLGHSCARYWVDFPDLTAPFSAMYKIDDIAIPSTQL